MKARYFLQSQRLLLPRPRARFCLQCDLVIEGGGLDSDLESDSALARLGKGSVSALDAGCHSASDLLPGLESDSPPGLAKESVSPQDYLLPYPSPLECCGSVADAFSSQVREER